MAEIAVVLFLQLMDIRDLTQTLWMTHVMIGLAVLYFIYTICNKFYHHTTTHALWICHLISCLRKEEAVYNASSRNIHLQIACGYAVFDPRTDTNLDALQKRADQNMYENKKQLKTFSYRRGLSLQRYFCDIFFTEFLYLIQLLVRKRKCIRKTVLIARL